MRLSDLDQLREIMKITGTPSADFIVKLQSQDVSGDPGVTLASECETLTAAERRGGVVKGV